LDGYSQTKIMKSHVKQRHEAHTDLRIILAPDKIEI
jgi:hypothetical protein